MGYVYGLQTTKSIKTYQIKSFRTLRYTPQRKVFWYLFIIWKGPTLEINFITTLPVGRVPNLFFKLPICLNERPIIYLRSGHPTNHTTGCNTTSNPLLLQSCCSSDNIWNATTQNSYTLLYINVKTNPPSATNCRIHLSCVILNACIRLQNPKKGSNNDHCFS